MAHVHGAAAAAKAAATHAATEHAGHVMNHAGQMMANLPKHTATLATGAAATGAMVAATQHSGTSFMSALSRHPLVVFGLGLAAGFAIHKYRKEIIAAATRIGEQGKDFALQQRENLEDLVAECHECEDDAGQPDPA